MTLKNVIPAKAGIHHVFWIPAFAGMTMFLAVFSYAQGFLPPQSTSTVATSNITGPLLIGEKVPESLAVTEPSGEKRTLLSHKSPLEVLAVVYLSTPCPAAQSEWPRLRRLNDRYKNWRVSFVAVDASAPGIPGAIATELQHEKLPWPLVTDVGIGAAEFKISGTPEVLVIDEYGVLKYRGPADQAADALNTVIGHIDAIQNPEPPLESACPVAHD
jgi:hypothetical protein